MNRILLCMSFRIIYILIQQYDMKKQKYNNPCIYYDDEFNQKRFKQKQPSKGGLSDRVEVVTNNKIDNQILNRYYFPEAAPKQNGEESLSSSATERKRKGNSPANRISRKLNNKSLTLSERSTKKYLQNELSKLTNRLITKKEQVNKDKLGKIKQGEVIELYRIISFYEGKLKSIQSQVKRYEEALQKIGKQCDEKTRHKTQVQQMVKIFSDLRRENEELSGKLEESDYKYGCLQQKYHKNEIKLNFLTCRYNFSKKNVDSSNSKSRFTQSEVQKKNLTPLSLKDKKESYGNIQSKINKMEATLHYLKKENDGLTERVQEKQIKILELERKIKVFQSKIKRLNLNLSKNESKIDGQSQKEMNQTKKKCTQPPLNQYEAIEGQDRKISVGTTLMMRNPKQRVGGVHSKKNNLLYSYEKKSYSRQDPLNKCGLISTPTTQEKGEKEGKKDSNSSLKGQSFIMEETQSKNIKNDENQNGYIEQDSRISLDRNSGDQSKLSSRKDKQSSQFHESKLSKISKISSLEDLSSKQLLIQKAKCSLNMQVFLKLKYQLLTDQLGFQDFVKQLDNDQICPQFFQQEPFNLDDLEAEKFYQWVSSTKQQCEEIGQKLQDLLIEIMPKFSNITFKKERDHKIQIANEMRNREEEICKMEQRLGSISFQQIKNMVFSWGLFESHLDVLCKAYYEQTKSVLEFNWNTIKQIINKWGSDAEDNNT